MCLIIIEKKKGKPMAAIGKLPSAIGKLMIDKTLVQQIRIISCYSKNMGNVTKGCAKWLVNN